MKIPLWAKIRKKAYNKFFNLTAPVSSRRAFSYQILKDEIETESKRAIFENPLLVISFDDISAMRRSPSTFDFGGDQESRVWNQFREFSESSANHRSTLFYIPSPKFKWNPEYGLTNPKDNSPTSNLVLVEELKKLISRGKIEIAQHGLHHIQERKPAYYSSFEFEWLSEKETVVAIEEGQKILQPYFDVSGFKPPAWSVGQLNNSYHLPRALNNVSSKFDYVCLSSPSNGLNYTKKQVSHIYPEVVNSLFNIPQNVSILWETRATKDIISAIIDKGGIVNIQLHFSEARHGLEDGISSKTLEKLADLCDYTISKGAKNLLCREIRTAGKL